LLPRLQPSSPSWRVSVRRAGFCQIFASTRWLNLKSQTNTIRKVTLVASYVSRPEDMVAENADRSALITEVRQHVRRKVVVVFLEPEEVERTMESIEYGVGRTLSMLLHLEFDGLATM
jgi:hypothetical protein